LQQRDTGLADGRHPDAPAANLATRVDTPTLTILHFTAWRYTDGGVVLTYAAVLDGHPVPGTRPLPAHGIAHSGDPTVPSPPHVCPDAVATHAARHLAWLRSHDEVVATALADLPPLWHAWTGSPPARPAAPPHRPAPHCRPDPARSSGPP
jgi:hypothetical protein